MEQVCYIFNAHDLYDVISIFLNHPLYQRTLETIIIDSLI